MPTDDLTHTGPGERPSTATVVNLFTHAAGDAIWIGADDGSTIYFHNQQFESMVGLASTDNTTHPPNFLDIVAPHHRERVQSTIAAISPGDTTTLQCRLSPDTDHTHSVQLTISNVSPPSEPVPYLVGTAHRQKDRRDTVTDTEFATAIVDHSLDGILVVAPDTTIEFVNPRVGDILGTAPTDLEGMTLDALASVVGIDDATVHQLTDAITELTEGTVPEHRIDLHADTDESYELRASRLDIGDTHPHVLVQARDVTPRTDYQETVERVAEAVNRLGAAESKQAVADVVVDIATDILDQPLTTVFLYDPTEDVLRPAAATDGTAPPTFEPGTGIVGTVYATQTPAHLDDARTEPRTRPYGSTMPGGYTALPLGDHGVLAIASPTPGTLDSAALKLAEILGANTESALDRVEREQSLRESQTTLRRQNERLEEFASIVSHDIRNPISVAAGHADLLATTIDEDNDHLVELTAALDRMDTLVEDLFALAKTGDDIDDLRWLSLTEIVEAAWSTVDTKDATLACDSTHAVHADEFRLRQLLENLFTNAINHGGPAVTVTVEDLPTGFAITDTGTGIPTDLEHSLFDPGVSADPDGTGYGLNIVTGVVTAHDWSIDHVDTDAGGARFEITDVDIRSARD